MTRIDVTSHVDCAPGHSCDRSDALGVAGAHATMRVVPPSSVLAVHSASEVVAGVALLSSDHLAAAMHSGSTRMGPWYIDSSVHVAAGATLTLPAGTVVVFAPGTGIVCRGVLQAVGTASSRVVLQAGLESAWAGVLVVGRHARAVLRHTTLRDSIGVDGAKYGGALHVDAEAVASLGVYDRTL